MTEVGVGRAGTTLKSIAGTCVRNPLTGAGGGTGGGVVGGVGVAGVVGGAGALGVPAQAANSTTMAAAR